MTTIIYISYEINIYLTLSMISKARSTPPIKQEVGHSGLPEKDGERGTNRFAGHDSRNGMSRVKQKQLDRLTASSSPCKAGCNC